MRKNAFTLVELLSVLVILSIIVSIVVINVFGIYEDSKQSSYLKQVELVKSSVKEYVYDNKRSLFTSSDSVCVNLTILVRNKYLNDLPIDARTNTEFSENFGFYVKKESNGSFTYQQVNDVSQSELCSEED